MSGLALNQWEKRLVRRLHGAGGVIVKTFEDGEKTYLIVGLGRAPSLSADRLIQKGVLIPLTDGLFGEAQTYQLAAMTPELTEVLQ